jgi:predicted membrane chloride channel (bestrophin family)
MPRNESNQSGHMNHLLADILDCLHRILRRQEKAEEIMEQIKTTLLKHATDVNAFSDQIAASIEGVRADIASLKAELVDATTVAQVEEILAPVMAKLGSQVAALKALDDENVPSVPPPPVEPPV